MRRFFSHPSSKILHQVARIAAIILVFTGAFWFYYDMRVLHGPKEPTPLQWSDLTRFGIHQFEVGNFLQLTIVPVFLMYLLTIIPYFHRMLEDQSVLHTTPSIFLALVVIQLLTNGYEIWFCRYYDQPLRVGLLVLLVGSLLGGWRVGVSLGVICLVVQSSYGLLAFVHVQSIIHEVGLWEFIRNTDWDLFLYSNFVLPCFSAFIWVAILACLSADLLGRHRYSPLAAMILGASLVFAFAYLCVAAGTPPGLIDAPSQALITALAAGMAMFMIRDLQIETSRRRAEAAELVRTQAELRTLRAQINPHFLFNALNTIRYMTRTDSGVARRLLLNLSEVFQRTLRSGEFVLLRDELSFVDAYLSLEKARLNERLHIAWGGLLQPENPLQTDTPLLDQAVPTLALQPIVENAVIHGIGKKKEGGTVTITVEYMKPDLVIKVEDDGVGIDPIQLSGLLTPGGDNRSCIGLCNVDRRLRLLYGEDHRLIIESEVGRGTRVTIRIPATKY
jgi:signal transduction histidine kinase